MEKKIFTLKEVNGVGAHKLTTVDYREAERLEAEGSAMAVDFGTLDNYQKDIDAKVANFRAEIKKMKESQDPKYKVDGAIDYFTAELKAKLEKEVAELNNEYSSTVAAMKEEARRDLANQTKSIPASERQAAADLVSEAITSVKFSPSSGAIDVLLENAPYYSDSRKLALIGELGRLADAVESDKSASAKVKSLYKKLNEVNAGSMLPVKIAQAIPDRADISFRHLKMTHAAFKDYGNNMHNGAKR
jgi:vacuolar-type H+-ATPase subunit I/STV1